MPRHLKLSRCHFDGFNIHDILLKPRETCIEITFGAILTVVSITDYMYSTVTNIKKPRPVYTVYKTFGWQEYKTISAWTALSIILLILQNHIGWPSE